MGRQLLLSASRHADGREMKVFLWQAFRVLVVEVTSKPCVTGRGTDDRASFRDSLFPSI
jgi:hypothetical protein